MSIEFTEQPPFKLKATPSTAMTDTIATSSTATAASLAAEANTRFLPKAATAGPETSADLVLDQEEDAAFFRSLERQHIYLNDKQIQAVRHVDGPTLTIAGAGTGKTSVLVARTAYLLTVKNVPAKNILLMTFSVKAAKEMKERLVASLELASSAKGITSGTFHSVFLSILRKHGYQQDVFKSEEHQRIVIKGIVKKLGLTNQDEYEPETILGLISSYKINLVTPDDENLDKTMVAIWNEYETWKANHQLMDYDDMLVWTYQLLQSDSTLLRELQERFTYILVDEWQDTNKVQEQIVRMLALPENNLFVVGDPKQTIHSFAGANPQIILDFDRNYPHAKVISLEINYRSTPSIVGLGNEIIRRSKTRHCVPLKAAQHNEPERYPQYLRVANAEAEAEAVLNRIRQLVQSGQRSYRDIAILFRTHAAARAVTDLLVQQEIPFVNHGAQKMFYEQRILKPLIAYFRLAIDPTDMQAIAAILPTLYINREEGMRFITEKDRLRKKMRPLEHLLDNNTIPAFTRAAIKEKIESIGKLSQMRPSEALQVLRTHYDTYLDRKNGEVPTMHKEFQNEILAEFANALKPFVTVGDFLAFLNKITAQYGQMQELKADRTADALSLMTIHKSKGLEFPVVFVLGVSEGILPHAVALKADKLQDNVKAQKMDAEKTLVTGNSTSNRDAASALMAEERRLAYVAVTRAKQELYLTSPEAHSNASSAHVSRFLFEAFGETPDYYNKPKPAHSALANQSRQEESTKPKKTVTVSAWLCTNATCIGWSKAKMETCPICNHAMRKGIKVTQG